MLGAPFIHRRHVIPVGIVPTSEIVAPDEA
jgi:hypothetical protein